MSSGEGQIQDLHSRLTALSLTLCSVHRAMEIVVAKIIMCWWCIGIFRMGVDFCRRALGYCIGFKLAVASFIK
jgi:hypothetical protein